MLPVTRTVTSTAEIPAAVTLSGVEPVAAGALSSGTPLASQTQPVASALARLSARFLSAPLGAGEPVDTLALPQKARDFANDVQRLARVKKHSMEAIQEASVFKREISQIRLVRDAAEAKINALKIASNTLQGNLRGQNGIVLAARLQQAFDPRNDLGFVSDLWRRGGLNDDFAALLNQAKAALSLSQDSVVARAISADFCEAILELKPFCAQASGEAERLDALVASLGKGAGELSRQELVERLEDVFDAEKGTLVTLVDCERVDFGFPNTSVVTDVAAFAAEWEFAAPEVAQQGVRDFCAHLKELADVIESDALSRTSRALDGLVAKHRSRGLAVSGSDLSGRVRGLRQEAATLYARSNELEEATKTEETEQKNRAIRAHQKNLRAKLQEFGTAADMAKKAAAQARKENRSEDAARFDREERVRRAQVKIIQFGSVAAIEAFVQPALSLLEQAVLAGKNDQDDLSRALKKQAQELKNTDAARPWFEAYAVVDRAQLSAEERAAAESVLGEFGSIAASETALNQTQAAVNELRVKAREIDQRAQRLAADEVDRVADGINAVYNQAITAIKDALNEEGEKLSELILTAASFNGDGTQFDYYEKDRTESAGLRFKAHRRRYYETLAAATRIFSESIARDNEMFSLARQDITIDLANAHAYRMKMAQGMMLPEGARDIGYYADEIPKDLNLPDRIPLFDRIHSGQDDAYRQAGSLPRYFDIALGTAVMFPHEGESLPTDKKVTIGFHGATTQRSSINSLALWVTTFPKKFLQRLKDGTDARLSGIVVVANPWHEFGPYDPRLNDMNELTRWTDAIRARYAASGLPVVLKGRSFGANLVLQHRRNHGNAPVVAMSGYNPTPFCSWMDLRALKAKGRTININAIKALDLLDPQWTYHVPTATPPRMPALVMVGRKDDYLQETPATYPEEFLVEFPQFRDKTPDDLGQLPYWQMVSGFSGSQLMLRLYPNGGHFLYNGEETQDTRDAAYANFETFLTDYVTNEGGV